MLAAGALHAAWNALAKATSDPYAGFALIGAGQAVIGLVCLGFVTAPAPASWPWLGASIIVHVVYLSLLAASYRVGDFSQMYPLARGSAVLFSGSVAIAVIGERFGGSQLLGLAAITAGLLALAVPAARSGPRGPWTALATGVSIAAYTILDGVGVRLSGDPLGYAAWLFAGLGPVAIGWALLLRGRGLLDAVAVQWRTGMGAGVISTLSYGAVIVVQSMAPLAAVAALRETGVVVSLVIGAVVFRERVTPGRVAAACAVVAGVMVFQLA
ncbi:hypothetical protein [Actinoplanes sp. NPDC023714]|uniref:EamA family transporter n=1 Tax=Actinoplanes sp. NPDC023714 TaxID=3154322 RepID=UPI0034014E81